MPRPPVALAGLLIAVAAGGCTTTHPSASSNHPAPAPPGLAEELRRNVNRLAVVIGERNCYRPAKLAEAADWIEAQFRASGYATRRIPVQVVDGRPFACGRRTAWNIEAERRGIDLANEIVVIGAHYDSKVAMAHWHADGPPLPGKPGTPGADDNASGVAGVLAIARLLRDRPLRRTVKFVAFANEEPPFFQTRSMGSLAYANALAAECAADPASRRRIVGMISFEMLGYFAKGQQTKRPFGVGVTGLPASTDYIAFLSDGASADLANRCGQTFSRHVLLTVRVANVPLFANQLAWSDDWSFWQIGVPAFSATDTAFLRNDHYHEVSDTPETLDFARMTDVVWGLHFVVEDISGGA